MCFLMPDNIAVAVAVVVAVALVVVVVVVVVVVAVVQMKYTGEQVSGVKAFVWKCVWCIFIFILLLCMGFNGFLEATSCCLIGFVVTCFLQRRVHAQT